jgi:DNA-directed RNA polymerase subunit omega
LRANMIQRRSHSHFDSIQIAYRAEELIGAASNRYKITVQVANRAKKRHRYEADNVDDPTIKPVMRAIIEMSDELTQPEILGD